jgi:hypothetical protein
MPVLAPAHAPDRDCTAAILPSVTAGWVSPYASLTDSVMKSLRPPMGRYLRGGERVHEVHCYTVHSVGQERTRAACHQVRTRRCNDAAAMVLLVHATIAPFHC